MTLERERFRSGTASLAEQAHVQGFLSQRPKRGSHLFGEELRLLPRSEVAAPIDLVEVRDVGVGLLDPAARGSPDLAGKRREADRDRNRRWSLA
jgi:hypothetical protein